MILRVCYFVLSTALAIRGSTERNIKKTKPVKAVHTEAAIMRNEIIRLCRKYSENCGFDLEELDQHLEQWFEEARSVECTLHRKLLLDLYIEQVNAIKIRLSTLFLSERFFVMFNFIVVIF